MLNKLLVFISILMSFSSCKSELKKEIPSKKLVISSKNDSIIHEFINKKIIKNEVISEPIEAFIIRYLTNNLNEYEKERLAARLFWIGNSFIDTLYAEIEEEVFEDFLIKNADISLEYEAFRLKVELPFNIPDIFIFKVYKRNNDYGKVEKHIRVKQVDNFPNEIKVVSVEKTVLSEKEWKKYRGMFYDIDFWEQPYSIYKLGNCDDEYLSLEGLVISETKGNRIHKIHRSCAGKGTGIYQLYVKLIEENFDFYKKKKSEHHQNKK